MESNQVVQNQSDQGKLGEKILVSKHSSTRSATFNTNNPPFRPGFLPALEGLRAVASLGIIGTHVAFQTGHDVGALWERVLGRFDFFVAVFFTLSGFLLWRSHRVGFATRRATLTSSEPPASAPSSESSVSSASKARHNQWSGVLKYYRKRVARIIPAYWVLVVIVLTMFPVGAGASFWVWLKNLTLTQVYFPNSLHGGLTHLWSLSVEVSFYLALPLLAVPMLRMNPVTEQRKRILWILALAAVSYGWIYIPIPYPDGVNPHIGPIAYFSWFAAGMVFAELESLQGNPSQSARNTFETLQRWASRRLLWLSLAVAAIVIAAVIGPEGLVDLTNWEFTRRQLCGLVFGACIIGPWTLAPASRFLETPVMQALGRWSYGIFLWHVALLSVAFPLLGVPIFSGHLLSVAAVTIALSIIFAAASYALVEEPARRYLGRVWVNRQPVERL